MIDYRDLALDLLKRARTEGASSADLLIAEGTEFSVTVRKGEVETLKDAGSKALGVRVFVGKRTATVHTSDFSPSALQKLVSEGVAMARVTGEDPAAGLPDELHPAENVELGLFDPTLSDFPTAERIEWARRAEAAALGADPEITNSQGGSFSLGTGSVLLANSLGFMGSYQASSASVSVVPIAERNGQMERDYWYTTGRSLRDLLAPEEVGRIAAQRTLRRLGAKKVPTQEVPIVFDPETAAEIVGTVFSALSGYSVFRNATFLKDRIGEEVASPLLTLKDEGRRKGGLGARPFDGEGLPTRTNVPLEKGVLRYYLCDSYSARKIGARPTGNARRGISGGPGVGAGDLSFEAGKTPPEEIVGGVARGLYVTDLIGFGVDLVSGNCSQGAVGHWIENGKFTHPVHEVTIAGNLKDILKNIDAVGTDLEFRGTIASPTLRVRRMTVSGS
ncbi:MAG TPA: TldD/PmbA family protein [Vicinamibacteria bacterium]|jgi:PmbA protein|nr:TldD/PmbA family protein [Vicinamibacteria bacterium]